VLKEAQVLKKNKKSFERVVRINCKAFCHCQKKGSSRIVLQCILHISFQHALVLRMLQWEVLHAGILSVAARVDNSLCAHRQARSPGALRSQMSPMITPGHPDQSSKGPNHL
jgi:hypothetical protein